MLKGDHLVNHSIHPRTMALNHPSFSNTLSKHRREKISYSPYPGRYKFALWPDEADVSGLAHKLVEDSNDVWMPELTHQ